MVFVVAASPAGAVEGAIPRREPAVPSVLDMSRVGAVTAAAHTEAMTRSGCPPQRHQRAADTLEIWCTRGSAGEEPHAAPRQVRWLPLRLDAVAAGWRWGLVVDDRLLLPTRPAAAWIEQGAAPPQAERVGTWWRVVCPADHRWAWFVAASTLDVAVRRALHGAAPIDTAVRIVRSQVRHDLLVAVVDATPPDRPTVRLVAQDLGGRNGPGGRWGCLLAADLDGAATLCA